MGWDIYQHSTRPNGRSLRFPSIGKEPFFLFCFSFPKNSLSWARLRIANTPNLEATNGSRTPLQWQNLLQRWFQDRDERHRCHHLHLFPHLQAEQAKTSSTLLLFWLCSPFWFHPQVPQNRINNLLYPLIGLHLRHLRVSPNELFGFLSCHKVIRASMALLCILESDHLNMHSVLIEFIWTQSNSLLVRTSSDCIENGVHCSEYRLSGWEQSEHRPISTLMPASPFDMFLTYY